MLLADDPSVAGNRRLERIFHPSDFSEGSEVAFAHALKIALLAKAELSVLHVSKTEDRDWTAFPGVRRMLERWHALPANSPPSAVPALGIEVQKVLTTSADPVNASLDYLNRNRADLVVLATHHHDGRARWLTKSVAEPLARNSHLMTLFVPEGLEGFVSRTDGSASLWNVLIPIAPEPSPDAAIEAASRLALALQCDKVTFTLLYVGAPAATPLTSFEERDGWTWNPMAVEGADVVQSILAVAKERSADLIAMSTKGHHGFLDALRGSTTEQVLRHARCPVLAVPASQQASS
jgi:nucleotide-binding universal stress UspA family protein